MPETLATVNETMNYWLDSFLRCLAVNLESNDSICYYVPHWFSMNAYFRSLFLVRTPLLKSPLTWSALRNFIVAFIYTMISFSESADRAHTQPLHCWTIFRSYHVYIIKILFLKKCSGLCLFRVFPYQTISLIGNAYKGQEIDTGSSVADIAPDNWLHIS